MSYPALVPSALCKTPINVSLYLEDHDENGAPIMLDLGQLQCNYQDTGIDEYGNKKRTVKVGGNAYFNGDIAPEIANIVAGRVIVHGEQREIVEGRKARNPDGSVNYTLLRVE